MAATVAEAAPAPPPGAPPAPAAAPARRRTLPWVLAVASYLALGFVADLGTWVGGFTHTLPTGNGEDAALQAWFLAVTPHLVLHGHSPFVTTLLDVPHPVNLVDNTTTFLPGLLMAPITQTLGPVASFNVLEVLAFAASATAAMVMVRRWTTWLPAAYVAGLLYGFSPYMAAQGQGHLHLILVPLFPLMVLVLDELVVRQRRPAWRSGMALGALAAAELLTSQELLADALVMTAVGLVVLAALHRHQVAAHARHALGGLAVAAGVLAAVAAWPLAVLWWGPGHVVGPTHPGVGDLANDLLSLVAPTRLQLLVPHALTARSANLVDGNLYEAGGTLGVLLLAALVLGVVANRRVAVVRFAGCMALAAFLLSLGPRLVVGGRVTGVPLPFALLSHLPELGGAVPARYSLFMVLFCALALGVVLDRVHATGLGPLAPGRRCDVVLLGGIGLCLVPLVPAVPFPTSPATVPAFFTSPAARALPPGSVVLAYPEPLTDHDQAMLWQADDGFAFRLLGGDVIVAQAGGAAAFPAPGSLTEALLEEASSGLSLPRLTPGLLDQVRADLATRHVDTVVVAHQGADPGAVTALFSAALGPPSLVDQGTWVWRHVTARSPVGEGGLPPGRRHATIQGS